MFWRDDAVAVNQIAQGPRNLLTAAGTKHVGEMPRKYSGFSPAAVAKKIVLGSFADDFILSPCPIMTKNPVWNRPRKRLASIGGVALILGLLFLSGCATARKTLPPAPAIVAPAMIPAPAQESKSPPPETAPVPPPPVTAQVAPPTAPPETPATLSELTILVESVPSGATIVVDGRPVGKAPLHLPVPATPLGFFRDYMEIRARFVATDETEVSRTATEEFTPREKVPAMLQFTPDGAQRTVR